MTTLIRAEYGSRAYGTHTVDSDRDFVEVVVETPDYVTGLRMFENKMVRTAEDGERSTADDEETSIYGMQKFFEMLTLKASPSQIAVLFLGEESLLQVSPNGQKIIDNRHLFVTKSAGKKFLGYMTGQRAAMTGTKNKRTNRPELVQKHGYDTKFGYHMIRLGMLGVELMETGKMELPMSGENVKILMRIRNGQMTKEGVLALSYSLEADLELAISVADLPEKADLDKVSALMHDIYLDEWGLLPQVGA